MAILEVKELKKSFGNNEVLRGISFSLERGEVLAIIGASGGGKTTLSNLIPRFYDVSEGEVLVNGINVKDFEQANLRKIIGYVSQKATLFSGTIRHNVRLGNSIITDEQIEKATSIAQATDFILERKEGFDAPISQGGANVSGGQRQRISIARAIAKNPEIYIFDDSFSALDYKTDKALRSELKKHTKNATSIIVAQRIGTIIDADKILVLDEGKLVGMGTHKQLLKTCEVYKQIAYSQLSKEELENV